MARIEPVDLRDLDVLLRLERACYEPRLRYSRKEYVHLLTRSRALNLKAVEGDRVVGFGGAILRARDGVAHVYTLNVDPGARRRGHARALLEALHGEAAARGLRGCRLEVAVSNGAAIKLYESMGYERVGTIERYYPGPPAEDAYVYVRPLQGLGP